MSTTTTTAADSAQQSAISNLAMKLSHYIARTLYRNGWSAQTCRTAKAARVSMAVQSASRLTRRFWQSVAVHLSAEIGGAE